MKAESATRRDDGQLDDEGRAEPVVLVAFFQHGLQRRQADRHGDDAGPVALAQQRQLHRLGFQRVIEHADHDRAGHQVDIEDVLPAPVLGQIAADGRADRGREGGREGKQRKSDRLLRLRQQRDDQRERHRDQHAAGKSLYRAQHDHLRQILREGAGDREQQEQDGVGQQIVADREHLGEPAAQRDHHDLGDQIGGRDPAAIIDAGADRALDIGERGVDDLDVEHRHEGAERRADHRDPGLGRDSRGLGLREVSGGSGVEGGLQRGHRRLLLLREVEDASGGLFR